MVKQQTQTRLTGGLTITSTPIGNMGDLSPRAKESFSDADIIACEDTRHTGIMLKRLGIEKKSMAAYHDHSSPHVRAKLIKAMQEGKSVTLVCDAGTPLISDPGYQLVKACHDNGIAVTSVPGASALLAGLVTSGLPSDRFFFGGFLSNTRPKRLKQLEESLSIVATLIFFESAKRLLATLEDIATLAPTREVAVGRELTKRFEDIRKDRAAELMHYYSNEGTLKGEVTLLIAPPENDVTAPTPNDKTLKEMLMRAIADGNSRRDAVAIVSEASGVKRKAVYALALTLEEKP